MNTTINIDDYLSHEDKKEIAKDVFRTYCNSKLQSEKDLERFLSNTAYAVVNKMCDEHLDANMKATIHSKVVNIVNNLTSYSVFKKPDVWDSESNSMYKFLQSTLEAHKPIIEDIVQKNVELATLQALKDDLQGYIQTAIENYYHKV